MFTSGAHANSEFQKFRTQNLNTADIILAAVEQAAGRLRYEDFTPPFLAAIPNCATIGYC